MPTVKHSAREGGHAMALPTSAFGGIADMAGLAAGSPRSRLPNPDMGSNQRLPLTGANFSRYDVAR